MYVEEFLEACPLPILPHTLHLGDVLGEGNVEVRQAMMNGNEYAVKVFNYSEDYDSMDDFYNEIMDEVTILNLVKGSSQSVTSSGVCYDDQDGDVKVYVVMEKLSGDMNKYIQEGKFWTPSRTYNNVLTPKPVSDYVCFNEDDGFHWCYHMPRPKKIKILKSFVSAVAELHKLHIVHADIKSKNIMFHYSGKEQFVKLIDMGAATHMGNHTKMDIPIIIGTTGYAAPEQGSGYITYKSDTYSLGVSLIEIWNGDIWENGDSFRECRNEVLYGLRKIEKENNAFGKLLRRCINLQESKRPSIECLSKKVEELF